MAPIHFLIIYFVGAILMSLVCHVDIMRERSKCGECLDNPLSCDESFGKVAISALWPIVLPIILVYLVYKYTIGLLENWITNWYRKHE